MLLSRYVHSQTHHVLFCFVDSKCDCCQCSFVVLLLLESPTSLTHPLSLQLWDVTKERRVRVMRSHTERVGVLTWNSHTLTSGSHDAQIHNHDVRISNHCVAQYCHHRLEVCGLQWSPDGTRLASGGNDNLSCVWSNGSGRMEPLTVLSGHQAAVKVYIPLYSVTSL